MMRPVLALALALGLGGALAAPARGPTDIVMLFGACQPRGSLSLCLANSAWLTHPSTGPVPRRATRCCCCACC